jgi:exonuclease VII small subunit
MKHSVTSSELRKMNPERQEQAVKELVRAVNSMPNGEILDLDRQIRDYEEKFKLSSDALRHELAQGKRQETWEVCKWLLLLDQRDLIAAHVARPG